MKLYVLELYHIVSKDIISKVSCVLGVIFMLTLCLLLQGGVFIGLVTLFFTLVEVEITFREDECECKCS
jgi:hypothetical protein